MFGWLRQWGKKSDSLGGRGEDFAIAYLRQQKMRILDRNVKVPHGEIDVLAQDGDELVFVEVRTRSSEELQTPEGSVREKKQRDMIRAACYIMRANRIRTLKPRIDVIALVWAPGAEKPEVRHHRAALALTNW